MSDAAGTLLRHLAARRWLQEIRDALDIPRDWLPDVYESPETTATLAGDGSAAAVGIIRNGTGLVAIGTSGVAFAHSDRATPDASGALHGFCHAAPDAFQRMGAIAGVRRQPAMLGRPHRRRRGPVANRLCRNLHEPLSEAADTAPPAPGRLFSALSPWRAHAAPRSG